MPPPARSHWTAEYRQRIDELIDEYRTALHDVLDDLTELAQHAGHADILREQVVARRSPNWRALSVPS